jgi:hypothetical protein
MRREDILTPASHLDECILSTTTMITTRLIGHRDYFPLKDQAYTVSLVVRSASSGVGLEMLKRDQCNDDNRY